MFLGKDKTKPRFGALDILKYIGPGLLVTVGFIDPGNWASNLAAGSGLGYSILWVITLGTIILIVLQHNAAHLGIASGLCLAEAANKHIKNPWSKILLSTGMLASVSTSMAEMLGTAIALNMLFHIPIVAGAILTLLFVVIMLFTNSYRIIEKWIIGFVAIIGLSFIYELSLVNIDWATASVSFVKPSFPKGSMIIIMSVLGAVVMPHNLFLHSEVIQSRQWNLKDDEQIKRQLKYEFIDTIVSMLAGWAINCAIVLLAASTFFGNGFIVKELQDAKNLLEPLLGNNAGIVFAVALLFAGIASTITSGFAAGTIFAGMSNEPFDIKDKHSRFGVVLSFLGALFIIVLVKDTFNALILSQMMLSIQLPITIFLQIYLTSSKKVMGKYKNNLFTKITLFSIAAIVSALNLYLFFTIFFE